jgi:hypothetical protein
MFNIYLLPILENPKKAPTKADTDTKYTPAIEDNELVA